MSLSTNNHPIIEPGETEDKQVGFQRVPALSHRARWLPTQCPEAGRAPGVPSPPSLLASFPLEPMPSASTGVTQGWVGGWLELLEAEPRTGLDRESAN